MLSFREVRGGTAVEANLRFPQGSRFLSVRSASEGLIACSRIMPTLPTKGSGSPCRANFTEICRHLFQIDRYGGLRWDVRVEYRKEKATFRDRATPRRNVRDRQHGPCCLCAAVPAALHEGGKPAAMRHCRDFPAVARGPFRPTGTCPSPAPARSRPPELPSPAGTHPGWRLCRLVFPGKRRGCGNDYPCPGSPEAPNVGPLCRISTAALPAGCSLGPSSSPTSVILSRCEKMQWLAARLHAARQLST